MIEAAAQPTSKNESLILGAALQRAEESSRYLQDALAVSTPLEALVLLPMIERSASLVNDIKALISAVRS